MWHILRGGPIYDIKLVPLPNHQQYNHNSREKKLTARVSSVSSPADLLSQCLKYSSTAAFCAAASFPRMAANPPWAAEDLPCRALLKSASRWWFSCSKVVAIVSGVFFRSEGWWEKERWCVMWVLLERTTNKFNNTGRQKQQQQQQGLANRTAQSSYSSSGQGKKDRMASSREKKKFEASRTKEQPSDRREKKGGGSLSPQPISVPSGPGPPQRSALVLIGLHLGSGRRKALPREAVSRIGALPTNPNRAGISHVYSRGVTCNSSGDHVQRPPGEAALRDEGGWQWRWSD